MYIIPLEIIGHVYFHNGEYWLVENFEIREEITCLLSLYIYNVGTL